MITFKQFLNEGDAQTLTPMDSNELILWMRENSTNYLKNGRYGRFIYRGAGYNDAGSTGIFHGTTQHGIRYAANTHNYYNLWIDNYESFKDYPKRSKSFICSTNPEYASGFGSLFLVIPKDSADVGIVDKQDIWGAQVSEDYTLSNLGNYSATLVELMHQQNVDHDWHKMAEVFQSISLDAIQDFIATQEVSDIENRTLAKAYKLMKEERVDTLFDLWEKLVTPQLFNLSKAGQMKSTNGEVWIQDDCAFLSLTGRVMGIDRSDILEFAEDYPELLEILEEYWVNPDDEQIGDVDASNVSDKDTLTFSRGQQR